MQLPPQMTAEPRWVVWRFIRSGSKQRKVPFRAADGGGASSTKPSDWTTYAEATTAAVMEGYDGVGFVLGDGFAGVDLDDCLAADGQIAPWADEIVRDLDAYAEVSPSGTGLKLFCRGVLPNGKKGKRAKVGDGAVELYCDGRYFTVTGDRYADSPLNTPEATEPLAKVYRRHVDPTPATLDESVKEFCRRELGALPDSVEGEQGHDKMFRAVCEVRRHGLDGDEAWELIHWFNDNKCTPAWSQSELEHKWAGACKEVPLGPRSTETPAASFELDLVPWREFDTQSFDRSFLVDQCVVNGEHLMVGGPHKSLKTSIMTDLGVSVASGTPFLGHFAVPEPRPVVFISGESGGATLQNLARRVGEAKGVEPCDNLYWGLRLPQLSLPQHLEALKRDIERTEAALCVVDPAYLAVLTADGADGAANVFKMGNVLRGFGDVGVETGCTMCLVHHIAGKPKMGQSLGLNALAFSGFREWARQWLILNPNKDRRAGKFFLRMVTGGSAGHGGEFDLEIDEGRPKDPLVGRRWGVEVNELDAEAEDSSEEVEGPRPAYETRVYDALTEVGSAGMTRSKLQRQLRLSGGQVKAAVESMLGDGRAEEASESGRQVVRLTCAETAKSLL